MKLPTVLSPDGRRAWSFAAIVGACMVFTVFAAVGVYLVRTQAHYSFWLAIAAHVQILVGMTALGWTLGRRMMLTGGRDGVTISDTGEAARKVADVADEKASEIEEATQ